jgi:hypothetical protein
LAAFPAIGCSPHKKPMKSFSGTDLANLRFNKIKGIKDLPGFSLVFYSGLPASIRGRALIQEWELRCIRLTSGYSVNTFGYFINNTKPIIQNPETYLQNHVTVF